MRDHEDRVDALFEQALELPPEERQAFLDDQVDTVEAERVRQLIAHDQQVPEEFLVGDVPLDSTADRMAGADIAPIPEEVGGYRIIRLIGQGGMGTVYEAEQENPRRRVALKMIRPGMISDQLVKRFQREAQVLGSLQHPGIAHIHEAGSADIDGHGRPYLAMEYVDGSPINTYVRDRRFGANEILELIARICDALQHAHQKGIIHRDLKPGNIFVVEHATTLDAADDPSSSAIIDQLGQPKILDFGVARVTDSDLQTFTLQTDVGQLIGTLAFMSPEQCKGDSLELDTRCDVYAIGVLAYELLSDKSPFDISGKPIAVAARMISEDEPTSIGVHKTSLRGDVETIISKAMEKDRERRYGSAAELAADIRRFLRDEPIDAHPPSAFYQFRKFAQRRKAVVIGIAATFLTLILGLIGTGIGLYQAREQRDDAVAARDEATVMQQRLASVVEFQSEQLLDIKPRDVGRDMMDDLREEISRTLNTDDLSDSDRATLGSLEQSIDSLNATNLARDVVSGLYVERAKKRIDEGFSDDPLVEADLRASLGKLCLSIGLFAESLEQREQVLTIRQEYQGLQHPDTFRAMAHKGSILRRMGRNAEAEELYRKALDGRREVLGINHEDTLMSQHNLGAVLRYEGKIEESERLLRANLEARSRLLGEQHKDTLTSANELAVLFVDQRKIDEALPLFNRILRERQRLYGDDHNLTILIRNNMVGALFRSNRLEEAEEIAREVLASYRIVRGDEHEDTITGRNNLGMILLGINRTADAEALFREAHEIGLLVLTPEHEVQMACTGNLSDALLDLGRPEEAEDYCRELLAVRRELNPIRPKNTARSLEQLGRCLIDQDRFGEAETALRECIDLRTTIDADHWQTHRARSYLGSALAGQGEEEEARPLLAEAADAIERLSESIPERHRKKEIDAAHDRADAVELQ